MQNQILYVKLVACMCQGQINRYAYTGLQVALYLKSRTSHPIDGKRKIEKMGQERGIFDIYQVIVV